MPPVTSITILYDAACGLCTFAKDWIGKQSPLVRLEFLRAGSTEAQRAFPHLSPGELAVVADTGEVWFGSHAWIVCLWALRDYRDLAFRLTGPALSLMAREAFMAVSRNRLALSSMLRLRNDRQIEQQLRKVQCPAMPDHAEVKGAPKSDETRQRILSAALKLFHDRGFEAATMRDIAEEAAVATGAAYYYFPSKDAIVMEFYRRASDGDAAQDRGSPGNATGLERRLCDLIRVIGIISRLAGEFCALCFETAPIPGIHFLRSALRPRDPRDRYRLVPPYLG